MYLLVIIKEVNVGEMLAALLPGGGLSTGYSYPLVTINSLAFASQLITVRSLCPPPSPSSPPLDGRILLFFVGGLCVFVVLFFQLLLGLGFVSSLASLGRVDLR